MAYTLGIDFGTNSVRALVVRGADGAEMGTCVAAYPSGSEGVLLSRRAPHLARQHPGDYLIGLERSVRGAIAEARRRTGISAGQIRGLGVDATGSSPLPIDRFNRPLALQGKWRRNLAAQCWLWKDHTSWVEADRITRRAVKLRPHYLARCGNIYSSEWFWAKIWRCLRTDPEVFAAAASWVELADWVPSVLAGVTDSRRIIRGICAAGHKALFAEAWGGLPDKKFLAGLDPRLAALRDRLYERAHDATVPAGLLDSSWAQRLGLAPGIPIAIGAFDAHYGAVGCGVAEGTLISVIGTSTCDCTVVRMRPNAPEIPGICGIVPGSILPGYFGLEAGQAAVGDIFKWWVEGICGGGASLHRRLAREAGKLLPGQSGLLALDWHNGNRTVLGDPMLSGLLLGCTLRTTRAEIYRALIEATAFGARVIVEWLRRHGAPVRRVVCTGGVASRSPLLMQIYADVMGCEIHLAASNQACARGAAIAAAALAGVHPDFAGAQRAMAARSVKSYRPSPSNHRVYNRLFAHYRRIHDGFGRKGPARDYSGIMKDLLHLQLAGAPLSHAD